MICYFKSAWLFITVETKLVISKIIIGKQLATHCRMNVRHEFNDKKDRQTQMTLFEVDDDVTRENILSMVSAFLRPKSSEANSQEKLGAKKTPSCGNDICAWNVKPNMTNQKAESAPITKPKGNSRMCDKDFLRDSDKHLKNKFIFYHYTDPRHYIEQYRRENTTCSSSGSASRNKLLEHRSFHDNEPLAMQVIPPYTRDQLASMHSIQRPDNSYPNTEQIMILKQRSSTSHITPKKENQKQIIGSKLYKNLQKQFRLSGHLIPAENPPLPSVQSVGEKDNTRDKSRTCYSDVDNPAASAISIVSLQKTLDSKPTVQSLPCSKDEPVHNLKPHSASLRCPKDVIVTYQFIGHKIGSLSANQLRTAEPCVTVGDKQSFIFREESGSKFIPAPVTLDRLDELDVSNQNDYRLLLSANADPRMIDGETYSSGGRKSRSTSSPLGHHDLDIILTPNVDSKLDYGYTVSLNDFLTDSSPLLKTQAYKLDIASGLNNLARKKLSAHSWRKKNIKSKPLGSGYKTSVLNSWNLTDSKQPPPEEARAQSSDFSKRFSGLPRGRLAPFFKFWNSSTQCKTVSHDKTLQQLTDWVLTDSDTVSCDLDLAKKAQEALREEHSAASRFSSGMWYDPNGRVYMSLATRYEHNSK